MMTGNSAPKTARGEATRNLILKAAESVIGAKGYADASISDITREAGIGQGTFYIYFRGKDEVFRELVLEMGRMTRHTLAEATRGAKDRIAAERLGLRAFLAFVAKHPALYNLVQEAQFVAPEVYRAYFQSFTDRYRRLLAGAAERGEISQGDAEVRAWALMGMAKALGERFAVFGTDRSVDEVAEIASDIIEHGLKR
jgi:AcrR family transcriptional regulator